MARPGHSSTLEHSAIRGIGDRNKGAAAKLTIPTVGIGQVAVTEVLAGNGVAGAAVDIGAYQGRTVRVEAAGNVLLRFSDAAATVVTATQWHAALQEGTGRSFCINTAITHVSAWGVGGGWSCVLFAHDEVD